MGYTIAEFKTRYCEPQAYRPFQQNREGKELIKLAEYEGIQINKVPGSRCAKLKPGKLEYINTYPIELLIRFFGNQLNDEGLKLKSGCPQAANLGGGDNAD